MSLHDFEPVEALDHVTTRHRCDHDDCDERSVVTHEAHDLCFYHAFVEALKHDDQAQRLALGFAVGHSLSDPFVTRRTN